MSGIVDLQGFSQSYRAMQDYVSTLRDVSNSPGYLLENYASVCKQVSSVNDMIGVMRKTAMTSIKKDLLDIMEKSVDWDKYRDDLMEFVKTVRQDKHAMRFPSSKLYPFKFNDTLSLEELDGDLLQNMYLSIADTDENDGKMDKKIDQYDDNKDLFNEQLTAFLDQIPAWEQSVVDIRTKNIPILMNNINSLYHIHAKFVYERLRKLPSSFKQMIDGKECEGIMFKHTFIPLEKSQQKFIKNAVRAMIGSID